MPHREHPRPLHQPQHLNKQVCQRSQVPLAKAGNRVEVGRLAGRDDHEAYIVRATEGDPSRAVDATGIGIEDEAHHHLEVVGRVPRPSPSYGVKLAAKSRSVMTSVMKYARSSLGR
jgi:hypothetical protein